MRPAILKNPVILEIPAEPQAMYIVRALVESISAKIGFQSEERDKLVLAVDEVCTNVIKHAYSNSGRDEKIVITFKVSLDCLEIAIRDFGSRADPATFRGRDLNDVRPGGLGTHLIKSAVDKIEYDNPPGGGTRLKLTKLMK